MGEYGQGKDRQESDEAKRETQQPNVPEPDTEEQSEAERGMMQRETQQPDVPETDTKEQSEAERGAVRRATQQPDVPERSPRKSGRESDAQHRRNIVRCNRLLLLEAFVLASLVIALILSFVLK
ncbi:MAG: hypothetical protein Q4C48_08025 [Lachnospiraceae bacterium]|nr:hypothetical protein [Lachnospiraceae bacterium]